MTKGKKNSFNPFKLKPKKQHLQLLLFNLKLLPRRFEVLWPAPLVRLRRALPIKLRNQFRLQLGVRFRLSIDPLRADYIIIPKWQKKQQMTLRALAEIDILALKII